MRLVEAESSQMKGREIRAMKSMGAATARAMDSDLARASRLGTSSPRTSEM